MIWIWSLIALVGSATGRQVTAERDRGDRQPGRRTGSQIDREIAMRHLVFQRDTDHSVGAQGACLIAEVDDPRSPRVGETSGEVGDLLELEATIPTG